MSLPAIDSKPTSELLLSKEAFAFNKPSNNTSLPLEANLSLDKSRKYHHASWSRWIISGASIAGMIWLLGSSLIMVGILHNLIAVARFKRSLTPVTDKRLLALLREVRSRIKLNMLPSLYSSTHIETPMTIGIIHPMIVLPEKLLTVTSREDFLCILGHESAHIKHCDNLTGVLQRIFIAFNWWNPLAYIINAKYSSTREELCDDYVVQMIGDSTRYTTCLVNLVEKSCLINSFRPAVGLVGGKRNLTKRLTRILRKEHTMDTKLSKTKKWLLTGLCAAIILCCAGIQTVFAQDFEAVERRLGEAVAEGELTLKQADIMMEALRRASTAQEDQNADRAEVEQLSEGGRRGFDGTFVRLTEQRIGEREYIGIVVRSLEGQNITVLLSREQEDLIERARQLREGQSMEVAYITEGGYRFVQEMGVE
ncbi:M56 family metallopeptidase [Planctomycetota bacterium]